MMNSYARRARIYLLMFMSSIVCAQAEANAGEECSLKFEVVAESTIGTIKPGDRIGGTIDFDVLATMEQNTDTMSYTTQGTMTLGNAESGIVSGNIRRAHVVRTPHFADYISIDASSVSGNLGGVKTYFDPMLVTVYAKANTLTTFDLPRDTREWNIASKRRVFQVHTPTAQETFFGVVESLSGHCSQL